MHFITNPIKASLINFHLRLVIFVEYIVLYLPAQITEMVHFMLIAKDVYTQGAYKLLNPGKF